MKRTPLTEAMDERDDAMERAETAGRERDELRAQLTIANEATAIASAFHEQQKATIEALQAQLAVVTTEQNELRDGKSYWQSVADGARVALHDAKCRIADLEAASPRTPTDLEERTGPTAFERNQLRDELAELRPQVDDLRAKLAAAEYRATMHERDADESSRAVSVLSTIIRASVEAIARGVK